MLPDRICLTTQRRRGDIEQVFVYGTLRRGESNHGLLANSPCLYQQAWVEGTLVDTGYDFPAAILDGAGRIYGEVYAVTPETLSALDHLEGYRPGSDANHYERVEVTVQTDQRHCQAFIYTYVQPIHLFSSIPEGDWRLHRQMKGRAEWLYFAYGSCMDLKRIREAGMEPHFQTLGVGILTGYNLQFRRRSTDGGRADLVEGSGVVEGKVYRIDREALDYLDGREGVSSGAYRPCLVTIELGGRPVHDVLTYVVVNKSQYEIAPPAGYAAEILRGARGWVSDDYYRRLRYICCDRWGHPQGGNGR